MNEESLLKEMEAKLIGEIPSIVRSLQIREPMYCLRLWYDGSDTPVEFLRFRLTLKSAALRKRLIPEKGKDLPQYIWCADEFEDGPGVVKAEVVDPKITQLYRKWSEIASAGDGLPDDSSIIPLRKMAQRVAVELNKIDWTRYCNVTDDFVVFPADGSHSVMDDFGDLTRAVDEDGFHAAISGDMMRRCSIINGYTLPAVFC